MITGDEISMAFNVHNDKKAWKARNSTKKANGAVGDVVHFTSVNGMVSLEHYVSTGKFYVKFHKFQGAWGDYVTAIARGLFTVLNTLKAAGLPFDAPASLHDVVIEAQLGTAGLVEVRFKGTHDPIMPELQSRSPYAIKLSNMVAQYEGAGAYMNAVTAELVRQGYKQAYPGSDEWISPSVSIPDAPTTSLKQIMETTPDWAKELPKLPDIL